MRNLAAYTLALAAALTSVACGGSGVGNAGLPSTADGGGCGGSASGLPGGSGGNGANTGGAAGASASPDAAADRASTTDAPAGAGEAGSKPGACPPVPACDAAAPAPGPTRAWRHQPPSGQANHRGRDLFANPGDRQWVIGNFQYGLPLLESSLGDEDVDIYLLRGCGSTWEKLGTAATTATAGQPDEEGVGDSPGRLFFEIPAEKALGPGRHRLHLVVAGDLSSTDVFIEVVPAATPIFVTDVDGTLTTSESAQTLSLLTGAPPDANPNAAQVLTLLAQKGYRPYYLTARPEWLSPTTHDWLTGKGFPPGIVHTTLTGGGASGAAAGTFKTDDLKLLAGKGLKPAFAIGNTNTDADAYNNADIQPLTNRIFFQYTDSAWGGRRIDDYGSLLSELAALPPACN